MVECLDSLGFSNKSVYGKTDFKSKWAQSSQNVLCQIFKQNMLLDPQTFSQL